MKFMDFGPYSAGHIEEEEKHKRRENGQQFNYQIMLEKLLRRIEKSKYSPSRTYEPRRQNYDESF